MPRRNPADPACWKHFFVSFSFLFYSSCPSLRHEWDRWVDNYRLNFWLSVEFWLNYFQPRTSSNRRLHQEYLPKSHDQHSVDKWDEQVFKRLDSRAFIILIKCSSRVGLHNSAELLTDLVADCINHLPYLVSAAAVMLVLTALVKSFVDLNVQIAAEDHSIASVESWAVGDKAAQLLVANISHSVGTGFDSNSLLAYHWSVSQEEFVAEFCSAKNSSHIPFRDFPVESESRKSAEIAEF